MRVPPPNNKLPRCDFCMCQPVIWAYNQKTRVYLPTPQNRGRSQPAFVNFEPSGWGACADCKVIFDARDPERLAKRAIAYNYCADSTPQSQAILANAKYAMLGLYKSLMASCDDGYRLTEEYAVTPVSDGLLNPGVLMSPKLGDLPPGDVVGPHADAFVEKILDDNRATIAKLKADLGGTES